MTARPQHALSLDWRNLSAVAEAPARVTESQKVASDLRLGILRRRSERAITIEAEDRQLPPSFRELRARAAPAFGRSLLRKAGSANLPKPDILCASLRDVLEDAGGSAIDDVGDTARSVRGALLARTAFGKALVARTATLPSVGIVRFDNLTGMTVTTHADPLEIEARDIRLGDDQVLPLPYRLLIHAELDASGFTEAGLRRWTSRGGSRAAEVIAEALAWDDELPWSSLELRPLAVFSETAVRR